MEKYETIRYGDIHFHTNYSDNQDHASMEQMIQHGEQFGITTFGTGDHNINLTYADWEEQLKETHALQQQYPHLQLINNCEITFRIGHMLVLCPKEIRGTAHEGFSYLFGDTPSLLIINHPYLPSDNWKGTILSHASGIEVINGAVLTSKEGRAMTDLFLQDYHTHHLIDHPHVACYADYLYHGIYVSALGNSDAHRIQEIGYGVTGFKGISIKESIIDHKTFASTDTDITIDWEYNQRTHTISWDTLIKDTDDYPLLVEWYRDREFLGRFPSSGSFTPQPPGYYWFGVRQGKRFAVSSPIAVNTSNITPADSVYAAPIDSYYRIWKGFEPTGKQPGSSIAEGDIFISEDTTCIDSQGAIVRLSISQISHDIVIDKQGPPELLDEFFLWFLHNELHEYKFSRVEYTVNSGSLTLKALLLPILLSKGLLNDEEIQAIGKELELVRHKITDVSLYVETPPLCHVQAAAGQHPPMFPLILTDNTISRKSHIYYEDERPSFIQEYIS